MMQQSHENELLLETVRDFMEKEIFPHEEQVDKNGSVSYFMPTNSVNVRRRLSLNVLLLSNCILLEGLLFLTS